MEFGKDFGLMHEAMVTGRAVNATRHFWANLAHDKTLFAKVVQVVMASLISSTVRVVIDCTKGLEEMIADCHFNKVCEFITGTNFPIKGTGKQEKDIALFHFNRKKISFKEVISQMDECGYRPTRIEDMLALGPDYAHLKIACLGSVGTIQQSGAKFVACIDEGNLEGYFRDRAWDSEWFFAAVPK